MRPGHGRVLQRLAELQSQLVHRHRRQRPPPLKGIGFVGCALDHLLELGIVETHLIMVGPGRLAERRAQPGQQRVATALSYPASVVVDVAHKSARSSSCLIRARKCAASAPYRIR